MESHICGNRSVTVGSEHTVQNIDDLLLKNVN